MCFDAQPESSASIAPKGATPLRGVLEDDSLLGGLDVAGVGVLDHGDLLRTTVAEVVTGDRTDQAAVAADAVERFADTGTVDDEVAVAVNVGRSFDGVCLLYTSPSPRDMRRSRMPSSA